MNAVILAAGRGSRLGYITRDIPKALAKVYGKELIKYTIDMARYIRASKIVVVGGRGFKPLKTVIGKYAPEAIVVENSDYLKGNVISLQCALPYINNNTMVFNVDHVFSTFILDSIISHIAKVKDITLFCDNLKQVLNDQMKIEIKEHKVHNISKILKRFDTGYIGLFYCPGNKIHEFNKAAFEITSITDENAIIEDILNYLIKNKKNLRACDIKSHEWFEVDTPEDICDAEQMIRQAPEKWNYANIQ